MTCADVGFRHSVDFNDVHSPARFRWAKRHDRFVSTSERTGPRFREDERSCLKQQPAALTGRRLERGAGREPIFFGLGQRAGVFGA